MPSIKTITAALAAALVPALTHASTLGLADGGLSTACGFSQFCCIPYCNVYVGDFNGCTSSIEFSGTCQWNFDTPMGTQDVDGCGDVQVTFLKDPDGNPSIDLYHKPSKTYDRYQFYDCGAPVTTPPQCGSTGGGCSTRQTLTGAQG